MVDGQSRVLPFDKISAELLCPDREENKETTDWVLKMAKEVGECFIKELRDPRKATSDHLSSEGGQHSWRCTADKDRFVCLGKMVTSDPAEGPPAALTQQMQSFGRVTGIHATGVRQTRINGDFERDLNGGNNDGHVSS